MSSIDNRIVSMKFDNAQFEKGVSTTISSMDKLKQSLKFPEAGKDLQGLGRSIADFNVGGMEGSIHRVSTAFTAMATVGITALSNITNKAVDSGIQLVKSLTVDPVSSGLKEYETNLGSIQTILANTQKEGATLKDVQGALSQLNKYSDQTIYNFSEMAANIGTFTAAGVKLDPAVKAIKGISNLAAISGSNAEQASTAMYQLSQALSAGRVSLQDWNSVVNAGMGGAVFQDALKRTARAHGVAVDAMIKKSGSFRESLHKGWLSSKILTETLSQFTGDLTDKQLKAQGYTEQQIKDIQKLAKTAKTAATQVKTGSQLIDTLQETAGSGWADTWRFILGDFEEAPKLFTSMNNTIGGWISANADARNKVLKDWHDLGGRTHLIEGIKNVFEALGRILKPIKDAFREIFPPMTGKRLNDMTVSFENFTKKLKISDETVNNLKRTFKGIFAVFSILKSFAHGVIKVIFGVFDALKGPGGDAGGGFLTVTANIGDFISGIDEMLKKTKAVDKFFSGIGGVIAFVIKAIYDLGKALVNVFTGGQLTFFDDLSNQFQNLKPIIDGVKQKIEDIQGAIQNLLGRFRIPPNLFGGVEKGADKANVSLATFQGKVEDTGSMLDGLKQTAINVVHAIGGVFSWLGDQIGKLLSGKSMEDWLSLLDTAFFIQLVRIIKGFSKSVGKVIEGQASMFENLAGAFKNLGGVLKGMQQNLKAGALLKIAEAMILMAIAIWILSRLSILEVAQGLGALAAMIAIMALAVKMLTKGLTSRTVARLNALGPALVTLGIALIVFAGAVAILGKLKPETLKQGLIGIVAILAIIVGTVVVFQKMGGAKTIASVAGGLMLMAIAMTMLAGVILLFSMINTGTMVSGLIKMAAVLAVVAAFMWVTSGLKMSSGMGGLIMAAFAINILAGALKNMGEIGIWQLAKGLGAMGIALAILATALWVMETTLPGAAALLVAVFALQLLVPVIKTLGEMDWKVVLRGIGLLALALVAIGIASMALMPGSVALALFGAALLMVGGALFLAGTGMLYFATALAILGVAGGAGLAVFTAALIAFIELLPLIGEQLGLAIVAWAKVIGDNAPTLIQALGKLLGAMLDEAKKRAPDFFQTMWDLLYQFLQSIDDNMQRMSDKATELIEKFVDTFGSRENIRRLTTAAVDLIDNFLNGLADTIRDKDQDLIDAGKNIGSAIIEGVGKGMAELTPIGWAVTHLINFIKGDAKDKLDSGSPAKVFIPIGGTIPEGMAVGIKKYTYMATDATEKMGDDTVTTMQDTIARISDVVDTDMNMQPVIAPVLDMTDFRKKASGLESILQTTPLKAAVSTDQATAIAAIKKPIEETAATNKEQQPIKFEQNNYSPKALSPSEIYRNTRNQLIFAKELMVG